MVTLRICLAVGLGRLFFCFKPGQFFFQGRDILRGIAQGRQLLDCVPQGHEDLLFGRCLSRNVPEKGVPGRGRVDVWDRLPVDAGAFFFPDLVSVSVPEFF